MTKYSVNQQPIEVLLSWIRSGDIAIPEIQRPFVWKAAKVRDLIDSLYQGYPVGYIITWQNPSVKLKNGELSMNKRVLIDGQQRITALTAAIAGKRVLNQNYKEVSITIAFNPLTEKFDVLSNAHRKDKEWINSIQPIASNEASISESVNNYMDENPEADRKLVEQNIENLRRINHKQVGIIELAADLDINTVTEIFIRINQKGVVLSSADFVMSKIAADESHKGNKMRKQIDYFCRLIVDNSFNKHIIDNDQNFVNHPYYQQIAWISNENEDLYIPSYSDVLRVAYTYKFSRGKFSDLVALLSGRNFETRSYEGEIIAESFRKLEEGLQHFTKKNNYQRFLMILESIGIISNKLISSRTSINFSYALYLKLRSEGLSETDTQHYVKRWLVMSQLIGRYSGSSESSIDEDIKLINDRGIAEQLRVMEQSYLGENFWEYGLVEALETSSVNNNAYILYVAAQCQQGVHAFLSGSMKISTLVSQRGDLHHIFPKKYLTKNGYSPKWYNQVANYVYTEQSTNIQVGSKPPAEYLKIVEEQLDEGSNQISTLRDREALAENMRSNHIPSSLREATADNYKDFLKERRRLMAARIKAYYYSL